MLGIVWGNDPAGHRQGKYGLLEVVGYADSNYTGDLEDKKSIMGYYFFLRGAITTWSSKRQQTVSTSTSKAEYVVMSHGVKEGVWIRHFLNKLLPEQVVRRMKMLDDNKTSLTLTKDPESQNCNKHIDVMHHHIQELVEKRELRIEWIPSSLMLVDSVMKFLLAGPFKKH